MTIVETISEMRRLRDAWLSSSRRIGFVPTMGALHDGHLSLVKRARQDCDIVVVSVFVNPTQFAPHEDFDSYPRTWEADVRACQEQGVDALFHPGVSEMYPQLSTVDIHVRGLTEHMCGAQRPGHFDGVALVVTKLFNIVLPHWAYFGQKDAQQAAIIKRLVDDLNMPVELQVCPIVRESDGLAMSSRNAYLSTEQRFQATCLYRSLIAMKESISTGQRDVRNILAAARNVLKSAELGEVDYVTLVDPEQLTPVEEVRGPVLGAVAVRFGDCRLIDNLLIDV